MLVTEAVTDRVTVTSTLESTMSETPVAPVEPAAPIPPVVSAAPAAGTHEKLPDDHPLVTALATKKAELADAKKALQAIEDAKLSDLDKRDKRIAELEKENGTLASEKLRSSVAASKSDPSKGIVITADLLSGSTKEELEACADRLIAFKGGTAQQLPGNQKPTGPVSQVTTTEVSREERRKSLAEGLKR